MRQTESSLPILKLITTHRAWYSDGLDNADVGVLGEVSRMAAYAKPSLRTADSMPCYGPRCITARVSITE